MSPIVQLDDCLFVRLDAIEAMELSVNNVGGAQGWRGWHVSTAYSLFLSPRRYGDDVFRVWIERAGTATWGCFNLKDADSFLAANTQKETTP